MWEPHTATLAIAAMPGLDEMAEHIDQQVPAQRRSARDTRSMLILAGAARAFASQEQAANALRYGGLWERVVASAAQVGRELPSRPPLPDQLDRWLRTDGPHLAVAAEQGFNRAAVALANQLGLLQAGVSFSPQRLDRTHHLTADGSVARPLSTITEDNALERSRAAHPPTGARTCETYVGKLRHDERDPDNRPLGLPFTVLSTHAGPPHLRIIFGFELYEDGDETSASMRLFDRVLPQFDGGAHTLHYDRLLQDGSLHELARRHGVLPLVEMHAAPAAARMAVQPATNDGRFRRGRYQQHAAKPRLRGTHYGAFRHEIAGRGYVHRLFSIDGQLVNGHIHDVRPSTDMEPLELLDLRRERRTDRWAWLASYALPCRSGEPITIEVDLAQQPTPDNAGGRAGRGNTDYRALERLAIGRVRPINERHDSFWEVAGRRSDSESTMATIKRTLPHRRASRLRIDAFHFDLIGVGLWSNAKAWDVHSAQHTEIGRREYRRQQRNRQQHSHSCAPFEAAS